MLTKLKVSVRLHPEEARCLTCMVELPTFPPAGMQINGVCKNDDAYEMEVVEATFNARSQIMTIWFREVYWDEDDILSPGGLFEGWTRDDEPELPT